MEPTSPKRTRPGGLGRGLHALIGKTPPDLDSTPSVRPSKDTAETPRTVPIDAIQPSPWQPRKFFRSESIDELISSIRDRGVLQPLWVRPIETGFELIAGERRLRAARAAGLAEIPVQLLDVNDREALELALIENLQRENLNPIEEAEGYRSLAEQFNFTQEQIATRVGRARTSVANAMRLLDLPDSVKTWMAEGRLSTGHAKALLGLPDGDSRIHMAKRILQEGWSVRQTERAIARLRRPARSPRAARDDVPETHVRYLADRLRERLGTGVSVSSPRTLVNGRKTSGSIRIEFYSNEDLDRLLELLGLTEDM